MKQERGDLLGCPVLGLVLELGFEMPEIRREAGHIFDRVQSYFTGIARDAIAAGRFAGFAVDFSRNYLADAEAR